MKLSGPAGDLESLWQDLPTPTTASEPKRAALLCHPHPQYGGSMHDGVLEIAAQALDQLGFAHLRFNFRGVGGSSGTFDNGVGEQDDLLSAWSWLADQHNWDRVALLGYSFGSAMSWAAHERCHGLDNLLLIAPPTAAMPFPEPATKDPASISTSVIVGSADSYCDLNKLPANSTTQVIDGADHFFSGAASDLHDALLSVLAP